MKGFDEIFPLMVAFIIAAVLFFGFVTTIKKTLRNPANRDTIDSTIIQKEQKRLMREVREKQKQLMRDQKQKIRDLQRR